MKIKESIRELRDICQVSFHGWGEQPLMFLQIRKVSIYLTWVLLHFPLTANNVTLLGIAAGILAGVLLGLNCLLAGVITLHVSMVLDFCDGEVSRYHKQQSKEGSYLDKIYHFGVHPSVFAGMTMGAYKIHPATWVIAAGFVATISVFLNTIVKAYASEIAIWAHCKRLLGRLNTALEPGANNEKLFYDLLSPKSAAQSPSAPAGGFILKAKESTLARVIFSDLSNLWDFPYIFFAATAFILLQLFVPMVHLWRFGFTPLEAFLLFYALTLPLWMIFFLSYVLVTRQIERGYNSFIKDLVTLMDRTSKMNITAFVKDSK